MASLKVPLLDHCNRYLNCYVNELLKLLNQQRLCVTNKLGELFSNTYVNNATFYSFIQSGENGYKG